MRAFAVRARRDPPPVPPPPRRGLGGDVALAPGQGLSAPVDLDLDDDTPGDTPGAGPDGSAGRGGPRRAWRRLRARHLREDNPQATWTTGSRLGTRAGSIALLAAIACGPAALLWQALTPPRAAPATAASATVFDERMESRRAIAGEVALQWVRAWLTTPSSSAESLRGLYAGEVGLPKTAAAVSELRIVDAVPADVGVWSVTVVGTVTPAGAKTGVTRYFAVPIAVSGGGETGPVSAAPVSAPAPVSGPGSLQVRTGGDYPAFVAPSGPLGSSVAAFLSAYLTGADVSRYLTPGSTVRPIGTVGTAYAAAGSVGVRADRSGAGITDASTPADGAQVRVLVTASLTERGVDDPQQSLQTQIPLRLTARGGRWEISAVDAALAATTPAQPTAAPS